MRQKIVGVYDMGFESVQLVLCEGEGGEAYLRPGTGEIGRIKVGGDASDWWSVVSTLLHEATEYSLCRMRCRYVVTEDLRIDPHAYLFSFDHQEFTEICARVAEFLAEALPDLAKAWKEWKKN